MKDIGYPKNIENNMEMFFNYFSFTGRTRRIRNSFACEVLKHWNRLPLAVASVPEQRAFKRQLDSHLPVIVALKPIFALM